MAVGVALSICDRAKADMTRDGLINLVSGGNELAALEDELKSAGAA